MLIKQRDLRPGNIAILPLVPQTLEIGLRRKEGRRNKNGISPIMVPKSWPQEATLSIYIVELPKSKAFYKDADLKGELSGKFRLGSITKNGN